MDEGGGEDDAGGEALNYDNSLVVEGLPLEIASQENRSRHADHAGKEDDEGGEGFEVSRGFTVSA